MCNLKCPRAFQEQTYIDKKNRETLANNYAGLTAMAIFVLKYR